MSDCLIAIKLTIYLESSILLSSILAVLVPKFHVSFSLILMTFLCHDDLLYLICYPHIILYTTDLAWLIHDNTSIHLILYAHHLLDNISKINMTLWLYTSQFKSYRGGVKWSTDSFDGVNVEMLVCHKRLQWRVSLRKSQRVCMMTFMCPRGGNRVIETERLSSTK